MKEILKVREIQTQQSNERNPKNAQDTNVIIQWKRILKVREIPM